MQIIEVQSFHFNPKYWTWVLCQVKMWTGFAEITYIFTYVNTRLILLVFYLCVLKTAALCLAYIRLYNSLFWLNIGQDASTPAANLSDLSQT